MTKLEQKIRLVVEYIKALKGVDIKDINVSTHEDIEKLNYAYGFAYKYFYN